LNVGILNFDKIKNDILSACNITSEIVHNDRKATLRLVYSLFIKYKVA